MGGVPTRTHCQCHIVGISGSGKCKERIFFAAKHFAIAKNLLTLHSKKMLYNIIIQHKATGDVIAGDRTTTKYT